MGQDVLEPQRGDTEPGPQHVILMWHRKPGAVILKALLPKPRFFTPRPHAGARITAVAPRWGWICFGMPTPTLPARGLAAFA